METRKAHSDFSYLVTWPSLHVVMTMAHYINYEHTFTSLSRYQKKEKKYSIYGSWCERPKQKTSTWRNLKNMSKSSINPHLYSDLLGELQSRSAGNVCCLLNLSPDRNHRFHLAPFFLWVPCRREIYKKQLDFRNHFPHGILSLLTQHVALIPFYKVSCHVCFSILLSSSLSWQFQ